MYKRTGRSESRITDSDSFIKRKAYTASSLWDHGTRRNRRGSRHTQVARAGRRPGAVQSRRELSGDVNEPSRLSESLADVRIPFWAKDSSSSEPKSEHARLRVAAGGEAAAERLAAAPLALLLRQQPRLPPRRLGRRRSFHLLQLAHRDRPRLRARRRGAEGRLGGRGEFSAIGGRRNGRWCG